MREPCCTPPGASPLKRRTSSACLRQRHLHQTSAGNKKTPFKSTHPSLTPRQQHFVHLQDAEAKTASGSKSSTKAAAAATGAAAPWHLWTAMAHGQKAGIPEAEVWVLSSLGRRMIARFSCAAVMPPAPEAAPAASPPVPAPSAIGMSRSLTGGYLEQEAVAKTEEQDRNRVQSKSSHFQPERHLEPEEEHGSVKVKC